MERNKILLKVQELLSEIIDNENLLLSETSTPVDVEDWDSLAHFQLVMEIQNEYGIRIGAAEIQKWKNVGDIVSTIVEKSVE